MNKLITTQDLMQLMPFLLMLALPVILLVIIAIKRNHRFSWLFTLATFTAVLVTVITNFQQAPLNIALLTVDKFSLLYTGVFAIVGLVITLLSHDYLEKTSDHKEEFYLLLVFATLGSSLMVASNDFVSLFLIFYDRVFAKSGSGYRSRFKISCAGSNVISSPFVRNRTGVF
jgi:NADH-quinone oxidoreductase subunit N